METEFFKKQRSYLLWLLARRDYPRHTLESKLAKRGVEKAEIKKLLDQLVEEKWFNEGTFKKIRTRQLIKRGYGPSLLRAKLGQEKIKIEKEEITTAYEEVGTTPLEQIREHIRKLYKRYAFQKLEKRELERKIAQALMRKGFPTDSIFKEIKNYSP